MLRINKRWDLLGLLLFGLPLAGCQQLGTKPPTSFTADRNPCGALRDNQVADVQIALAQTLEEGGSQDEAAAIYLQALKKDPRRSDACLRLAVLYDRQGKFEEADRWYEQAHSLAPGDPEVYASLGYGLYLRQQWEPAARELRHAIALSPEHKRAHNNLGLVLARCGRQEEALTEFRRAGCSEAESRANLAHALTLEGRWNEALAQYQAAMKREPGCAVARKGMEHLRQLQARLESNSWSDGKQGESDVQLTAASVPTGQVAEIPVCLDRLPMELPQAPARSGDTRLIPK